jgi:hypothetical protein
VKGKIYFLKTGHPLLNRFNQTDPELLKGPMEKAKQQEQNQPEPSDKKPEEQQEKTEP